MRIITHRLSKFGKSQAGGKFPSPLDIFETSVVRILSDAEAYTDPTQKSLPEDIEKERDFMHRIADVREELVMIQEILDQQKEILQAFIQDFENHEFGSMLDSSDEQDIKGARILWEQWKLPAKDVDIFTKRLSKINKDAERIENLIQNQLNMKRTYASIRDTRTGLILSAAVIGFTVITIIFAPLAFMTSLFALPLEGLLKNQYQSDGGNGRDPTPAYTTSRLEEFARDTDEDRRRGHQTFQVNRRLFSTQREERPSANDPAAGWKNAFKEGLFNDSDYHAVKDLDSLDDGNAHRLNRVATKPGIGGSGNPAGYNSRPLTFASKGNTPMYDPLNPGYSKKPRQPSQPLPPGHRETSLGGIVPPGVEVRRWDPKRAEQAGNPVHFTPIPNIPGTGRDTPVQARPQQPPTLGRLGHGAPLQLQPTLMPHEQESTLLPHQRRPAGPAGPAHNTPDQNNETQVTGNLIKTTTLKLGRVIFRDEDVTIMLVVGLDAFSPGQVSLHERPSGVVIWNLHINTGRAMRGDIRLCLQPFQYGSSVHLRRQDNEASEVRSSQIRFSSISAAQKFEEVVKSYRKQQENSRIPILIEMSETELVPQLESGTDSKDSEKTDEQAPENQVSKTDRSRVDTVTSTPLKSTPSQPIPSTETTNEDLIDLHSPESLKRPKSPIDLIDLGSHEKAIANSIGDAESVSLQRESVIAAPIKSAFPTIAQSQTISPSVTTQYSISFSTATVLSTPQLEQDIATIEAITAGVDLSQDSLRVLSSLMARDYEHMIRISRNLLEYLMWARDSSSVTSAKQAAMQVTTMQLKRYEGFSGLDQDEQRKAIAVVYANILHGNAPIIRSVDEMIMLRQYAHPCPPRVRRFNEYFLRVTGRLGPQQPSTSNNAFVSKASLLPMEKHLEDARSVHEKQWPAPEEKLIEIGERSEEETVEKTNKFLALLRDAVNSDQPEVNISTYAMSNSSASTIRPGAVLVPRTNPMQEADASPDRTPTVHGIGSSRWANQSRNTSTSNADTESRRNSPAPSHGRTATGDLSSLSGITGRLATLELDDIQYL
ncbi:hypothetical protein GL218_05260 [Daldinia childiae]|uniref:uncharacterized protein n=1 Tax=Daldinia childiae TaxID=326645 RepID=UPI001447C19E|nr:uncharacterized protein GL218_05260 [Daldinia childiae]KAF3058175.1 hypothetical protein GL218_05260 [Daldinia childiae]